MASPTPETTHPTLGGKSLESLQAHQHTSRAPYKSWRKKYRKMRVRFDQVLEDNKRTFRDEQKLEDLARRLQEELDTMMEILLEINQDPALPVHLRYNIADRDSTLARSKPTQNVIPVGIEPKEANDLMRRYKDAVMNAQLPHLELHFVREQIQERLAEQGVKHLSVLEQELKPEAKADVQERERTKRERLQKGIETYKRDMQPDTDASFLTAEHEDSYLARVDAKLRPNGLEVTLQKPLDANPAYLHQAELTPRELERQLELLNPQSQHNWLKSHPKISAIEPDGREWVMQNEESTARSTGKKRASGKGSMGKAVGDRMLREGQSPSEASGMGWDDEFGPEEHATSGRKKAVDKDPTFRGKIAKGGGSTKTKRKRTTDEGAGGGKRIRAADIFD